MNLVSYLLGKKAGGGGSGNTEMTAREWLAVRGGACLFYYTNGTKRYTDEEIQALLSFDENPVSIPIVNYMFYCQYDITKVPFFDTSNATDMSSMFRSCSALTTVPLFDTSNVTNMSSMFNSCVKLESVPMFDTSKVVNMNGTFQSCNSLTTVPLFNTSNVTDMYNIFNGCDVLQSIPLFDTSKVVNMTAAFLACSALTTVPLFDTSNVTKMNGMFKQCTALKTIPSFDTRNVTTFGEMFRECSALETVPALDTRNVTSIQYMFYGCSALTTISSLDLRNATTTSLVFNNLCTKLTDITFKNIKSTIQVASSSWGTLLTVDSLINLIYELRDTGSSKTLTIGSANLTKLADVYVKTIEITDEMRAEDDLIDEKLPFVVCESTDEGAMLLTTEYVLLKHWAVK